MKKTRYDVIIIGAGAAGLMCAMTAGRRGRSVLILDHGGKPARKVLVSGGGRCNFTNLNVTAENYLSSNPHFCKSALSRYRPSDFIGLLDGHSVRYHEKEDGQMFCIGSSRQIVDMLLEECRLARVDMKLNCTVSGMDRNDLFGLRTSAGPLTSTSLVVATGGLSYPDLGATGFGHRVAEQFGLRIIPPGPALVPLTLSRGDIKKFGELSGVSFGAIVSCGGRSFRGSVLFTHRGLSGPAVLQASSYWAPGQEIYIDCMPGLDAHGIFLSARNGRMEMKTLLSRYLPGRFAAKWCDSFLPSRPLCQYNDKELLAACRLLHAWPLKPAGTEGYRTAEVTSGGVDTDMLSSKTMESKDVAGLYFIGEVIDVTGHLGGYNLHWAWASGWAAGQCV